jgi:hypothetical protein
MPSSAKQFMPLVREKFPKLAKQYEQWYAREACAPEAYRKVLKERLVKIRKINDFSSRPWEEKKSAPPKAQMTLAWDIAAVR